MTEGKGYATRAQKMSHMIDNRNQPHQNEA